MKNRQLLAIALLSMALIAYQLALMQLFSLTQWHHFAYLVIAVALLGFGASGTAIALFRDRLLPHQQRLLPLLAWASSAAMATMPRIAQTVLSDFDSYLLFVEKRQLLFLLLLDLFYFVPFFLGALAVGLMFVAHTEKIGCLYCANLLGSGLGGLFALLLMRLLPPEQITAATAGLAVLAGICAWPEGRQRLSIATVGIAWVLFAVAFFAPAPRRYSQYKAISYALNLPDARIEYEKPSPEGLVQMVSSPSLRRVSGLSLSYSGTVPVWPALFSNGHNFGPLIPWPVAKSTNLWDYRCEALPYRLLQQPRVLALQVGSGFEIAQALTAGARRVTATESHRGALQLLQTDPSSKHLFSDPRLRLFPLQPRAVLAQKKACYDLITLPRLGSFGGGTGLFALQEEYQLTGEAFQAMWNHLSATGMLRVSSWVDFPLRRPLKLLTTLAQLLEQENISAPSRHLIAIRDWGSITYLLKKTPFRKGELATVRAFCHKRQFDPLLLPDLAVSERAVFHHPASEQFFHPFDLIMARNEQSLFASSSFELRPTSDDRPFFSRFLRWHSLPELYRLWQNGSLHLFELGYLILLISLLQLTFAAIVLIILPLCRQGFQGRNRLRTFCYFSGLGIGYMFFEMALIHQLGLYLGEPIFATAAGIAALLMFSGIGSFLSSRLSPSPRLVKRASLIVAALLAIYSFSLAPLLQTSLLLSQTSKAILALVFLLPPALALGFPFPLGLRLLNKIRAEQVAWAWSINGCFSVLSTSLATLTALELGFHAVILLAAAAYLFTAVIGGKV